MTTSEKVSRTLTAKVVSTKMDKTIVVSITRQIKHKVYGKYITLSSKLHVNDSENVSRVGDVVLIKEVKPISKTKNWDLVKVLQQAIE